MIGNNKLIPFQERIDADHAYKFGIKTQLFFDFPENGILRRFTLFQKPRNQPKHLVGPCLIARKEVQQNFPIRTGETAFLFLQHFIKMLKAGGRGGVVIKNTFLSNTDNASVSLRKLLLESCNLHTVLDCPGGTFQGAGVKTVVLFFEKGAPTRRVWFYQLDPGRNLGKTNPLNDDDLAEFVKLQKTFADSPKSWSVDAKTIDQTTFDLSVKNPNGGEEITHRTPKAIMQEIAALDAESASVLGNIKALL